MSVIDYLDAEVFTSVFGNDIPMINSENIHNICRELKFAVQNREQILVYGDYDMDGFSATQVWRELLGQLGAAPPVLFKYGNRTHQIDPAIIDQVKFCDAKYAIICDTGSSLEDKNVLNILHMNGCTTIVIDHHVFIGDYNIECANRLTFNAYEERAALGEAEVSGAYASLLVGKVLCEKYFNTVVPFNAKVFALASMYSDSVDMSTPVARALYASVALVNAKGPVFFSELNKYNYLYGRRFFSFIVSPKMNGCFRMERWDILNRAARASNKYEMRDIVKDLQEVHTTASNLTKAFTKEFEREDLGDLLLCTHDVTDTTRNLHIRNFTGVVATRIAEECKKAVVLLVRDSRHYEGSFRDYYGRELLDTFRLFCQAGGHPPAFGISVVDYSNFHRHLQALSKRLDQEYAKPYVILNSGVISNEDDLHAIALYNEYMNVGRRVMVSHNCNHVRLLKATMYYKYYQIGLPTDMPLVTKRTILEGNTVLIEPAICRGTELREME